MTVTFRTHTGEIVQGERLAAALQAVGDWYEANAYGIRKEDLYASHVTTAQKEANLAKGLKHAKEVRQGAVTSFSVWQRVNEHLTGDCVALLSPTKTS